jgi:hypothetical protein
MGYAYEGSDASRYADDGYAGSGTSHYPRHGYRGNGDSSYQGNGGPSYEPSYESDDTAQLGPVPDGPTPLAPDDSTASDPWGIPAHRP